MYCENCGTKNKDGVKFCIGCGQPLGHSVNSKADNMPNSSETHYGETGYINQAMNKNYGQIKNKGKMIPKKALIGICLAVVALIVILFVIISTKKTTIDLNKYLTINSSGYDGYGIVEARIDWDAIEKDYGSKVSFTKTAKNEYGFLLSLMTPIEAIEESVSITLDESRGVSNGDSISYRWNIDSELSKYVKCKIKSSNGTYTVSGLAEVDTFDAFANLDVQFSGISPNGRADLYYYGSELSTNDFQCDNTSGLRNGDVIEVFISINNIENYVKKYGRVPEDISKTFTVSGLQEYVSSYTDITEALYNELKSEAEDSIYSYIANSYVKTSSLKNLEYAGYIFESAKDGDNRYLSSYNDLYIIYKGDVSSSEGNFRTAKVYYPVRFSNIIRDENGDLSYEENHGISGVSDLDGEDYYTRGYVNPLTCYLEIVESNRSDYTFECGDGFEVYSDYESISELDDISEEFRKSVRSDAKEMIENYIAETYNGGSYVEDLMFEGEYLLTAKEQGNDFKTNNMYFVVYSATVSNSEGAFKATKVYFPVEYDGIVKLADDEYIITLTIGILGNSDIPDSQYYTKGYVDGTEMYTEIVSANRENYKFEVSDGLKKFGE